MKEFSFQIALEWKIENQADGLSDYLSILLIVI